MFSMNFSFLLCRNLKNQNITTLPEDVFQGITRLETLDLSGNMMDSGSLPAISDLTALYSLNLSHNQVSILSESILTNFTSLVTLDLSFNKITTLPQGVFEDLNSIQFLWVDHQQTIHFLGLSLHAVLIIIICLNHTLNLGHLWLFLRWAGI